MFLLTKPCYSLEQDIVDKELDSLIALESKTTLGMEKLRILKEICKTHYNVDTIYKYARVASVIAKSLGDEKYLAFAYSTFSWCEYHYGDYQKSLGWSFMVLGRCEKIDDPVYLAHCYKQLGYTYYGLSDYYNADRYCREALEVFDSLQINDEVASTYRALGMFCMEYGYLDVGSRYIQKAYQIDFARHYDSKAEDLMFFGYYDYLKYLSEKKYYYVQSAVHWYNTALKKVSGKKSIAIKSRIFENLALSYNEILENAKLSQDERASYLDSCEKYSDLALSYAKKIGSKEKKFIADYCLARCRLNANDLESAEKQIEKISDFINENSVRSLRFSGFYYKVLLLKAKHQKDYKAMLNYMQQLKIADMKRYTFDLGSKISKIQAKENYLQFKLKTKNRYHKSEEKFRMYLQKSKRINTYLMFVALVIIASIVYIIFVSGQQVEIKNILTKQSRNIVNQNEELDKQRQEFLSLRQEFLAQKQQLENKKRKFIKLNQSMYYSLYRAWKIQNVLIPSSDMLRDCFGECLVYFKPLQMVSGDFYWALKTPEIRVLVTADCTGHGISGGFLSMLGISSLNDIVTHRDLNNSESLASDILEDMRKKIISSLHQEISADVQNDTIDMAICIFGKNNNLLQYAGANRPLWISGKDGIRVVEADEFSTGMDFSYKGSFTNHKVKVEKGEIIYTFSDGITDMFGGKNGNTKFGQKRLKQLLEEISVDNFSVQYQKIDEVVYFWTSTPLYDDNSVEIYNRQVDDKLLIGIKI